MKILRRLLSLLLSLLLVAMFYAFAVMMEGDQNRPSTQFVVEEVQQPLTDITPVQSQDANLLAERFGAAFPLPQGFQMGQVQNGRYHTYVTRLITLQGEQAVVTGIRPASAAAAIAPKDAQFTDSKRALLGYPMLVAKLSDHDLYSYITPDAAFFIQVQTDAQPGAFTLVEPR